MRSLSAVPSPARPSASTVQYCTPPGKFFSLNGGLDEEELLSELRLILDSLFAEGNQLNV